MMGFVSRLVCLFYSSAVFIEFTPIWSSATSPTPVTPQQTCEYWKNVAYGFSQVRQSNGATNLSCLSHHGPCNGFDCTGNYDVRIPVYGNLSFGFCFGATLNHCDNPPSIDFYLQVPSRNVTFQDRIKHNDSRPIGNLSMGTKNFKVQPYFFFSLKKDSSSFISFKIKIRERVTEKIFGTELEQWPSDLEFDVLPEQEIPYTPCNGTTVPPIPKLKKCVVKKFPTPTGKPHSTKFSPPKTTPKMPHTTVAPSKSPTLKKKCVLGSHRKNFCRGQNEVCVKISKNIAQCKCLPGYIIKMGVCVSENDHGLVIPSWRPPLNKPTTPSTATVTPHQNSSQSVVVSHQTQGKKLNITALIVGSVLGGLIVIVLITTIIVFVVRRKRMYYRGHQLLLSEEDTDVVI